MDLMSNADQDRLVNATETAIKYTHEGMEPNAAIEKVARAEQFSPRHIERMVQGFNKAKSVYMMKEASTEDRARPFSIADSAAIIQSIFSPKEKVAATSIDLPGSLVDRISFTKKSEMSKVASAALPQDIPNLTASSYMNKYRQHSDFMGRMVKLAQDEISTHKYKMMESFRGAADTFARMTDSEIQKTARLIVNGYGPTNGNNILKVVANMSRKDIPEMTKTASAAVFPHKPQYDFIQSAYSHANKMADAEVWKRHLEKEAGLASTFLANAAAELVTDPLTEKKEDPKEVDLSMQAKHYNADKALQAKRALYSMMNSDDFTPYSHSQVIKAWNQISSEYPEIMTSSPAAARKLMLENLEGVSSRDISEIKEIENLKKGPK